MILRCESKAFYQNKNYKTLQNVLLRCPGHINDYKIPVPQRKNYTPTGISYSTNLKRN